ncbi:MAG: GDP-mannose 4,6-dehydratase [Clostridiales bacterium]|jgi:nucleoside-diphosphate-sugar epimerase|nr:GDP-mannose 4,6-dehydratase [Clostridiales bacterium]
MKVLVTGAGGMIGSHMAEILHGQGHDVCGTFYRPTTDIKKLRPEIKMKECDVRYFQSVYRIIAENLPEQIFHLAAQSYPAVSWEQPQATTDTNVTGTINVFESVKAVRALRPDYDPTVLVACSSAEYGLTLEELDDPAVKETAALKPLHPYGVSKACQDMLAFQYFVNDRIKTVRARIFNTTGPRKVNDVTSDFTMRAIEQEKLGTEKPTLRVGNIEAKRAIMDVRDLVKGLILLADRGERGDVYNVSSERIYQIKDIIGIIEKQMRVRYELVTDPKLLRPTDEKIIAGDVSKLKRDTGWEQSIPLETTVAEMLSYWRSVLQ